MMNDIAKNKDYEILINQISHTWQEAKSKAAISVNAELLTANWQTGKYIVEFEQGGNHRAEYGKNLINTLSMDLTMRHGRGFAFVGRQYEMLIGSRHFIADLVICCKISIIFT